jgi:hypothetical protein
MLNSAQKALLVTTAIFAGGLWALNAYGGAFLHQMSVCDTEVSYLDLARQASEHEDYATADAMYKQALNYAKANDPTGQAENAMLLSYAKFALEKKHDTKLFLELQSRAQELKRRASKQGVASKP